MKTLVVYFSKTGNTRKVAKKIANVLHADIEELGSKKFRKRDPTKYDLVVIGSPVWGFSLPPIISDYLIKNYSIKRKAYFCTCSLFSGFFFSQMRKIGGKPIAELKLRASQIDNSDDKILNFCKSL